jgi:hypothetical protein
MNSQPLLPVSEPPKTLEYAPAGDDAPPWLIGDWRAIAGHFSLQPHEVNDWHRSLAGQGRPWVVIRRIFSIAPLWGDGATPDDIRSWSWAELSKSLGVTEKHLRADLDAAIEFWKKARLSLNIRRAVDGAAASAASSADPADPAQPADAASSLPEGFPDFQIHQHLEEAEITAILTPFRFHTVKSPADRLYVANRILELRKLLEDKYKREQVRQLIVMELSMANYEATIHTLKSRLETIQKRSEIDSKESAEIRSISESLATTEKALTALSTTYQKQADEIGGDEMEASEARRLAIGTASHLIEAHRKYYASGNRDLIDGMFTAEEVVWLTTPLSIRPAQYRPDVVLRVREAFQPENLWSPDYKPSTIQRDACRRMLKLVQAMADEAEPEHIVGIDDVSADSLREDDDGDPAVASEALVQAEISPPAETEYLTPDSPRPQEPFMAVG